MNGPHLSDIELQQYVQDRALSPGEVVTHVQQCMRCQAGIEAYRAVFEGLGQEPRPAFDFDVAALVLAQLPAARGNGARRNGAWYIMAAIIFCITSIPVYLFRRNAFYVFTGVSTLFLLLILSAALVIVLSSVLTLYKRYQRRMQALQF